MTPRGLVSRWRNAAPRAPLVAGAVLLLLVGVALVSLPGSIAWHDTQSLDAAVRHPPSWKVVPLVDWNLPEVSASAHEDSAIARPATTVRPLPDPLLAWGRWTYSILGHDDLGRSLYYRLVGGFLISLAIGLAAAGVAVAVGTTWGAVAALSGGWLDRLLMRVVDVLYGLPYTLMVILLKVGVTRPLTSLFGGDTRAADVVILFVAIGGVSWLTTARVVRGQILSLRTRAFVEAARAMGAGRVRVLIRHIVPNVVGPVLTYAALVVPQAIMQEAFLSYLGIGIQQPIPSLGRLCADGVDAVNNMVGYWWLLLFPCLTTFLTLLSLNVLADGVRDALDPGSRVANEP